MIKLRRFLKGYKKEVIIGPLCKLFEAILELFVSTSESTSFTTRDTS